MIASVIELGLPVGKKYWYCPKGPLSDSRFKSDVSVGLRPPLRGASEIQDSRFFDELKFKAKEAGAIFLRVEPVREGTISPFPPAGGKGEIPVKSVQPRCTTIVDLSKSEDELMKAMHEKTRYNVRLADRHGVTVQRYDHGGEIFDEVWKLMSETAARDGFHLHLRGYYEKLMPYTTPFVARFEEKLLAAAIVMFDQETVTYLHGASSNEHRNVMAPYALHWAIMKEAKARGYHHYDFWGIDTGDEPEWKGITRFKTGFGGETVCAPGTFDLIINPFWYSLYSLARKFL